MPADESEWSRQQDKQFENALVTHPDDTSDRWEKIAAEVSGKSVEEVKDHYDVLVDDVDRIESGFIKVPCYNSSSDAGDEGKKGGNFGQLSNDSNQGGRCSKSDQERRKGIAWTEDEHRLFLLGLEKYGKGDWRSISRNFVVTRTPTQVASHAQKYFIRLNSMNKDRRRQSIHDITNVNNGDASVPITGQANVGAASSSKSNKVSMFDGQPAVGTPVNPPHMAYGVGAPVVPGAPMNMGHITYHPSGRR